MTVYVPTDLRSQGVVVKCRAVIFFPYSGLKVCTSQEVAWIDLKDADKRVCMGKLKDSTLKNVRTRL